MHPRDRIAYRTEALKLAGLWREPADGRGTKGGLDTRSNDYLGLAARGVSRETGFHGAGRLGAGASRVVSGTWQAHETLERELASWLGTESCLLFSSGYAANVGALSALVGPGETVISDSLNHASIIDGCRLSRSRIVIIPHGNPTALERALADTAGVRWVVFESYYGMDGDSPDLRRVREVCDAAEAALIIDEAHALGVFGSEGRGLCAATGVTPDVLVGGLGKAFGAQGGFVATSALLRDWLWNRARSFVFSTGVSPLQCELILERLAAVRGAEGARSKLRGLERRLDERLTRVGVSLPARRHGPIFPVVFGAESDVLAAARITATRGVACQPIRPPTVPDGSSRLRVILNAAMTAEEVDLIGTAIKEAWRARKSRDEARLEPFGEAAAPHDGSGVPPPSGALAAATPPTLAGLVPDDDEASLLVQGEASSRAASAAIAGPLARLGAPPRAQTNLGSGETRPGDARSRETRASALHRRTWVILGVGTGVGKTYVARALVEELARRGTAVAGLKPVETGMTTAGDDFTDARTLAKASLHVKHPEPHPLYAFRDPVTPALAARRERVTIELPRIRAWLEEARAAEAGAFLHAVVETAGGAFSPLADGLTNLDLATAAGEATWLLVGADRLGVLHDISATLEAMGARGARPDYVILSAPAQSDASTGTNAAELRRLPDMPPIIELGRGDTRPLAAVLDHRHEAAARR